MENFNDGMNEVFYPNMALIFMAYHLPGLPNIFCNKYSDVAQELNIQTHLPSPYPFAPNFLVLFLIVAFQPGRIEKIGSLEDPV